MTSRTKKVSTSFHVGWQDDLGIFWKSYEIQAIDHSPNHAFNLWCFLGNTPDIHLIISAAVQQCLAVWDAPRGHVVNFFLRMHKRHGGFVSLLCLLMKMWILVRLYREAKTCPRDSMNYQHNTSALAGLSTRKVAKEYVYCSIHLDVGFFLFSFIPCKGEKSEMGHELNTRYITTVDSWQLVGWMHLPLLQLFFFVHLFSKDVALSIFFDAEGQDFKRQILCW